MYSRIAVSRSLTILYKFCRVYKKTTPSHFTDHRSIRFHLPLMSMANSYCGFSDTHNSYMPPDLLS